MYSILSNFLKKYGLELSYNEQYALVDGLNIFVKDNEVNLKTGSKFKVPKFQGKNELERIENAMFATLLQNILQRFTIITEDERAALDVLISKRIIAEKIEIEEPDY